MTEISSKTEINKEQLKQQILEKSRKENAKGDERERQSKTDSEYMGYFVFTGIITLFLALEYTGVMSGEIVFFRKYTRPLSFIFVAAWTGEMLAYNITKYRRLKKKRNLIGAICFAALLVAIVSRTIWW